MRTVDERVAAVRSRSSRLRRKRNDRVLGVLACLMALPLVGLAGGFATGNFELPAATDGGLFGAASLLGSSAGGYVLVAVLSFTLAVLVTLFIMLRRKSTSNRADDAAESAMDGNKEGGEQWQG